MRSDELSNEICDIEVWTDYDGTPKDQRIAVCGSGHAAVSSRCPYVYSPDAAVAGTN
jgi:hypothetical protein